MRLVGSLSKIKMDAQAKAAELGIDPFEILLLFAANKWKELGYQQRAKTMVTAEGAEYTVEVISPELRVNAAKEAANYVMAKRKSIEYSLNEIPDEQFDQEVERRYHKKILNGEIKVTDAG